MRARELAQIITEAVKSDMAREQRYIDLHNQVLTALAPYDGKGVTKRLATAVSKAMPDMTVAYDTDYGMCHLSIWGQGLEYRRRYSALLAYQGPSQYGEGRVFHLDLFDTELAACYGRAARERQARRAELLSDSKRIADIAAAYWDMLEAKSRFDLAMGDTLSNAAYYAIRDAINADNWMK